MKESTTHDAKKPETPEQWQRQMHFARLLAEALEEKPRAFVHTQIARIAGFLGGNNTLALAQEAKTIYDGDGLWTRNHQRKRTLGGVFFYLARQRLTSRQWYRVASSSKTHRQNATQRLQTLQRQCLAISPLPQDKTIPDDKWNACKALANTLRSIFTIEYMEARRLTYFAVVCGGKALSEMAQQALSASSPSASICALMRTKPTEAQKQRIEAYMSAWIEKRAAENRPIF